MTTTAARRIGFRYAFAYLLLYLLPFPLHYLPGLDRLALWHDAAWAAVVSWVAAHVLHITRPLMLAETGSSDRTFDYIRILCIAVAALVAALVWWFVDRRRQNSRLPQQWLRTIVRYTLAMAMINYGLIKVLNTQFPAPDPERLMEPYGESTPMGLMWTFMGYSSAYTLFSGISELTGGALLFFRRTTAAGALLLVAVLANVCVLNYAYDVPAKLFATHLFLMAVFLFAPAAPRVVRALIGETSEPASPAPPALWAQRPRLRGGVKTLIVGAAVVTAWLQARTLYFTYGAGATRPPLYGILEVESFVRNGNTIPPLLTDTTLWRRIVVSRPGSIRVDYASGAADYLQAATDTVQQRLTLWTWRDSTHKSVFVYAPLDSVHLVLAGRWGDDSLQLRLRRIDLRRMPLLRRGYHWINEFPLNR
jgi:uncharacterized membrane protein YphA (DoxX/SURF4 family)